MEPSRKPPNSHNMSPPFCRLLASNKVVPTVEVVIQALAGTAAVTSAGRTGMATATVAATGALSQLTRQTGHFSSLAAVPSLPLTGQHPTGRTLLLRQPLSTTCGAGNASGSASNSGSGRNPGSSRRASSSVDPDNLRSIKGVGPLNEGLLRRKQILTVQDLREIVMDMKDPDALPEYLHVSRLLLFEWHPSSGQPTYVTALYAWAATRCSSSMHSGHAGKTSMSPQLPSTSTVSLPHAPCRSLSAASAACTAS